MRKGKLEHYKLVLVVREDLRMGRGKIAAQVSLFMHCSLLNSCFFFLNIYCFLYVIVYIHFILILVFSCISDGIQKCYAM